MTLSNKHVDLQGRVPITKDSPFFGDKLRRAPVAKYLTDYMAGKYRISKSVQKYQSFVLNINSEWGLGKTYFLTEWAKQLRVEGYVVVNFDAWQNDFTEQPLIGFMSEIEDQLKNQLPRSKVTTKQLVNLVEKSKDLIRVAAPTVAFALVKALVGIDIKNFTLQEVAEGAEIDDAAERITEQLKAQLYEDSQNTKKAIHAFKGELKKIIELIHDKQDIKLPLFIFVDELDRCRPPFAIRLLEDIKHIFGVEGIYFVIATDSIQLGHSIKAVYGAQFDSRAYLRRFFEQEYSLPDPNRFDFACHLFSEFGLDGEKRLFSGLDQQCYPSEHLDAKIFSLCADLFRLTVRDEEQACAMLDAIRLTSDRTLHTTYLSFCIMLRLKHAEIFDEFCRKKIGENTLRDRLVNLIDGNVTVIHSMNKRDNGISTAIEQVPISFLELIAMYLQARGHDTLKLKSLAQGAPSSIQRNIAQRLADVNQEHEDIKSYPELVRSAERLIHVR